MSYVCLKPVGLKKALCSMVWFGKFLGVARLWHLWCNMLSHPVVYLIWECLVPCRLEVGRFCCLGGNTSFLNWQLRKDMGATVYTFYILFGDQMCCSNKEQHWIGTDYDYVQACTPNRPLFIHHLLSLHTALALNYFQSWNCKMEHSSFTVSTLCGSSKMNSQGTV